MTPEDKLLEYDGSPADVYLIPGDYASYLTARLQARLPEVREYSQAEADAPAGPTGAVLGDVPFPPGMEVALNPTLGLGPAIAIPADLRQALPQLQLDPEHATHVPVQRYQELYQRFWFPRSYIARLYPELHERLCPPSPRYDLTEVAALCPVYLPDGIDPNQGIPLEPFLTRVLSMDANPSWVRACCFLLLNMYALKNRQPGVGDFQLLTVIRDMQVYRRTVFMMIMGETLCWVRDIGLHVTNFNVHHRGCSMLLQAWALDKLCLIPPVPARSIPTYGPANFHPRSRGQFGFEDNPVIRWTCPWWRIRLVTAGSMNLSYVLYASLDRSMAYFPDRINRQYGVVQRVPRSHNFESGPMT
ncbi:hypothetical protein JCGZ_26717 [Jatropha curcas]|uniref:Aminotransferase-like plant mobile domain-containing protein n=1 Tax=Jatropha curcas TaxID=180498 RepID=A0A067JM49_JATCU|nr:hypothetical protein JCGZ_26717 [Jatropha curcas]